MKLVEVAGSGPSAAREGLAVFAPTTGINT